MKIAMQVWNAGRRARQFRLPVLVLVSCVGFAFARGDAHADNTASASESESETAKSSSEVLDLSSKSRLRGNTATLGERCKSPLSSRPSTDFVRRTKGELRVVAKKKRERRKRSSTATFVKPSNPYQRAFDSLRRHAAKAAPSESGRAEVSFIVGRKGQPIRPAVIGLSASLASALTSHLGSLRFPKEHAGQYFVSKLLVVASRSAPEAKVSKKSKQHRRARRPRAKHH